MMIKIIEDMITNAKKIQNLYYEACERISHKDYLNLVKDLESLLPKIQQFDAEKQELIDALIDDVKMLKLALNQYESENKRLDNENQEKLDYLFKIRIQLIEKHTGKLWEAIDVK